MDDELRRKSEAHLDAIFGEGQGRKHTDFLEHLASPALRETLHRYHAMEADTSVLSVEENYLLGMCVLCAVRSYGPAAMFAKTLLHMGVPRAKLDEAMARLSMWVGGVPAAEAAGHIQRAIREYEKDGKASLSAWFPEPGAPKR
jgi:hypothetical protein